MYACSSVYVPGCYVRIVSVFKKTFTRANVQHEEEGNKSNLSLLSLCLRLSCLFDNNHFQKL